MPSITDVAKHAHVGVGTVSRVISGKGYVAEATREKVLHSIKELNYVPNELARNLLQKKTNTIALILPDLTNRFYTNFINEAEYALRKEGYKTLICNSFGKETNEQEYLNMLESNLVDGVITLSNLLSNESYARIKKPMVSFDSVLSRDIPMVYSDHVSGGRAAADILIKAGCKKVLQFRDYVDLQLKNSEHGIPLSIEDFPYVNRHMEFEKRIREAGLEYHDVNVMGAVGTDQQRRLVLDTFAKYPDVDGVMGTDIMALQFAQAALDSGRKIPDDLKIVAYDGTDIIDLFFIDLSYISQPVKEIAQTCVNVLLRQINGENLQGIRIKIPIHVTDSYN